MILYTTDNCYKCQQMKAYLTNHDIMFLERDAKELLTHPIGKTLKYLPIIEDNGNWTQGLIPGKEYIAQNYLHV